MSSHAVGDAMNGVINLFEAEGVWSLLGLERSRDLILQMVEIARLNDCGSGDALQDIGPRYKICIECFGSAEEYRELRCPRCWGN